MPKLEANQACSRHKQHCIKRTQRRNTGNIETAIDRQVKIIGSLIIVGRFINGKRKRSGLDVGLEDKHVWPRDRSVHNKFLRSKFQWESILLLCVFDWYACSIACTKRKCYDYKTQKTVLFDHVVEWGNFVNNHMISTMCSQNNKFLPSRQIF